MTTVADDRIRPLPPLVGKQSIADMLGVPLDTVDDWRAKSLSAIRAKRTLEASDLPVPDRVVDNRPFWHPQTVVDWAVGQGRLPAEHGLVLPARRIVLWSQQDIAKHFGVTLGTVRERWRFFYVHAVLHSEPIPVNALVKEDFLIDGTPFWLSETVIAWGKKVGKLGPDGRPLARNGLKWVAEPVGKTKVVDPLDELIAKGELWDWAAMAAFFGVKIKTVKMWASKHSSGYNFPAPDGGKKLNGNPVWRPPTVKAWAAGERRLGEDEEARPVRGGRRPGQTRRADAMATSE